MVPNLQAMDARKIYLRFFHYIPMLLTLKIVSPGKDLEQYQQELEHQLQPILKFALQHSQKWHDVYQCCYQDLNLLELKLMILAQGQDLFV